VIGISRPSIASLLLEPQFQGAAVSTATGFVVKRNQHRYLVTNFHVVSGRNPDTHATLDPSGTWPDAIRVWHHAAGPLGQKWTGKSEPLYDSQGIPLWLEHPVHHSKVDVVALPLTNTADITIYEYDPWAPVRVAIDVAGPLSIVGFPFGLIYGGVMAVWVQGFVASEWGIDFGNLPRFLIDSRTREGQSGSPVIFHSASGSFRDVKGNTMIGTGPVEEFVGVYSGRISKESDLGFVWKGSALCEIIENGVRGTVSAPEFLT
jgi:hypothetical protein